MTITVTPTGSGAGFERVWLDFNGTRTSHGQVPGEQFTYNFIAFAPFFFFKSEYNDRGGGMPYITIDNVRYQGGSADNPTEVPVGDISFNAEEFLSYPHYADGWNLENSYFTMVPKISADLSTLTGWSGVSSGSHTLKVKAKATGYRDSALSQGVSFAKAANNATVTGLGNEDPTSVVFTKDSEFPTSFEEWTDSHSNVFIKIPTMYRKVLASSDGQITSFAMATSKLDNDYVPYPVFVYNGNVLPYVYIGKFCYSSTTVARSRQGYDATYIAIDNARQLARAVGTGYQQYDVHFQKLFVDLALLISQDVNFQKSSTGYIDQYLGLWHLSKATWIDGICASSNNEWLVCYDPANYVDQATSSSTGYSLLNYVLPTQSSAQEVKTLGYDTSHPFINFPATTISNSSYNTYYCDAFGRQSGSHPAYSTVGYNGAVNGLWMCSTSSGWNNSQYARLCYRPIS